jgi:NADPH:quinone reductase-like Zn-dependent oxidoreductase
LPAAIPKTIEAMVREEYGPGTEVLEMRDVPVPEIGPREVLVVFTVESRADDLATLGELLRSGEIRSVIEARFPLADVAIPLERQGRFHARGKTVVAVEGTL